MNCTGLNLIDTTPNLAMAPTAMVTQGAPELGALPSLRAHWPEYLIEAALLGGFMVSACVFSVLLEHPGSPVRQALASGFLRRALGGLAMGLTAVSISY